MSEFTKEEVIREPERTLDISSGYAAYQGMGEAAFQVYVNGFYGMAITIPGVSESFGGPLATDLLIVVPSGAVEDFRADDDEYEDAEI